MLKIFRKLTLREIISHELKDAHLSHLSAQTAQEFAESNVSYRGKQIQRLEKRLRELEPA